MRKHKLKRSVFVVASTSLLLLSSTAFNAAAEPPIVPEEEASNYLSVPAIFAEGYGLTGLPAVDDRGSGLPGSSDPDFDGTAYCVDGEQYYLQADETVSWRADWAVASEMVAATVDWSDEVIKKEWNDKSVIPVSVTLHTAIAPDSMTGYVMTEFDGLPPLCLPEDEITPLFSAAEEEEEEVESVWGTNGDTYESDTATAFTVCAKLTIQKINGEGGDPVDPAVYVLDNDNGLLTTSFAELGKPEWLLATIDVEGRIVYLYNWNLAAKQFGPDEDRSGWYRLTFSLEPEVTYTLTQGKSKNTIGTYTVYRNVSLDALAGSDETDAGVVYPAELNSDFQTTVDIEITHLDTGE